jgi:hypothetical protein
MSDPVALTVLGWSGCPTTANVRDWLARVCAEAGIRPPKVEIEYIETDEDAAARGFIGSPTFVRDGVDLFPEPDAAPALTCRLYRLRDGRPSPLPDPADLLDALGAGLSCEGITSRRSEMVDTLRLRSAPNG